MYLLLMHGRLDPRASLDNWGFDGPIFKIDWMHVVYNSTYNIGWHTAAGDEEQENLAFFEDLAHYDDKFYGDWEIFSALAPAHDFAGKSQRSRLEILSPDKMRMSAVLKDAMTQYCDLHNHMSTREKMLDTWVRTRHGDEHIYRPKLNERRKHR